MRDAPASEYVSRLNPNATAEDFGDVAAEALLDPHAVGHDRDVLLRAGREPLPELGNPSVQVTEAAMCKGGGRGAKR